MACCCSLTGKKGGRNPPHLAIASEGVGYHCCCGCRWRQMTTTSLHGSSSLSLFVALKKRIYPVSHLQARGWVVPRRKKFTPACSCMQGGGLLSSCIALSSSVISNIS